MTRLILSLEEGEKSWLKRRSRETGESMAQIVRRAIRRLEESEKESLDDTLAVTSGLWRRGDGLRYQRKIRRQWE
jgi:broad specificity phosphatase PhoE